MTDYTTDGLIEDIKRRGSFPSDEQLLTKSGFISIADEQLRSFIVPQIMEVREEYFVTFKDFDIEGGKEFYYIPEKAIGLKLRDITIVDANGESETNLPNFRQKHRVRQDSFVGSNSSGGITAYYVQGNRVGLYPKPNPSNNSSDKLRMYYFRRPGELVTSDAAGQVTTVDTGTNTLTLSNIPLAFTVGTDVDIIRGVPGFDAVHDDLPIQARAGSDITLTTVDDIEVGDWVTISGTSPIPQIPPEGHDLLAQDVTVKVMEAIGDDRGFSVALKRYETLYRHFLTTITPRNEGETKKIIGADNISRRIYNDYYHHYGS